MELKPEARQEYDELRKVMDYVNLHPYVEGKFDEIKCGNLNPEDHGHPILICGGNPFLKIGEEKYHLELARNYLGPKGYMSDKGIYLCVSDILHTLDSPSRWIYGGILQELVLNQDDRNLVLDDASFRLGYHPLEGSKIEEHVYKFFSQAEHIIGLVNSPEISKNIRDLEKILSLTKQD